MVQRFCVLSLFFMAALPLGGCAGEQRRPLSFEPPAESSWVSAQQAGDFAFIPGKSEAILLPGETGEARAVTTLAMRGCSIKDRFDRSSTLAYNFSEGQDRLELNVKAKGPSLTNPGRFEFNGIGIRFTHKFQNIKTPKERCRYESPFQGLVGSAYNEFYLRKDDTVSQELHAKGLDFWN